MSYGTIKNSFHTLAIVRGRYSMPNVHISERICNICGTVEDEIHFPIHCPLYKHERDVIFSNITLSHPEFCGLSDEKKFTYIFENTDQQILTCLGYINI